jgi:hypothetical protein
MIRTLSATSRKQNNDCSCSPSQSINTSFEHPFFTVRRIILLFVFFIATIPLFAQKFDGGLLAGFNGSQVRGDILSNGFHKLGFVGGVWVQSNINENFYWNLELKYSQKGSRVNPSEKNNYYSYIYRLNYIDIPILFGYQHKDYFSLFGGLSFDVLINKSAKVNYEEILLSNTIHNWEVAFFAGIKVNFSQLIKADWASNFKLDFRCQFSAIPIYTTNNKVFYYSPYSQFNSVISSALYYTIKWK